jgi:putative (di)nucleoside polyphosphate hydrolase
LRHLTSPEPLPGYRPCVGIFLLDKCNRVFVAQRADQSHPAWQLPQGGIDAGEDPLNAARRELLEEVGTDRAQILQVSRVWRAYDLPAEIAARIWGGRYRGQSQLWLAFRFTGSDGDIRLDAHHPEFSAWRWVDPASVGKLGVSFKRGIYEDVAAEFRPLWDPVEEGPEAGPAELPP